MRKTAAVVSEEDQLILSTVSPGTAQKRLALAFVIGLVIVFVLIAAGPLGSIRTNPVAAFVPAYATAMFVCDSITCGRPVANPPSWDGSNCSARSPRKRLATR
jgi:hypothetical protein